MLNYHEIPWPHFTGSLPEDFYNHVKNNWNTNIDLTGVSVANFGSGYMYNSMGPFIANSSDQSGRSDIFGINPNDSENVSIQDLFIISSVVSFAVLVYAQTLLRIFQSMQATLPLDQSLYLHLRS